MDKKIEPLLRDEEETFGFLRENERSTKDKRSFSKYFNYLKKNRVLLTTVVISLFVVYFMSKSIYAFYIGFHYFDEAHENFNVLAVNNKSTDELDVTDNSVLVYDAYKKITATNVNDLASIFKDIYSDHEVMVTDLSTNQKLAVIFSNLGVTCESLTVYKTYDDIKNMAINIFDDESLALGLENIVTVSIDNYTVTKDAEGIYTIALNACNLESNDFVLKGLSKATTKGDELYIYEYFGYFINTGEGLYDVYGNAVQSGSVITNFVDQNNDRSFNSLSILPTYKWTYKKGNDNNYYFVSITPVS